MGSRLALLLALACLCCGCTAQPEQASVATPPTTAQATPETAVTAPPPLTTAQATPDKGVTVDSDSATTGLPAELHATPPVWEVERIGAPNRPSSTTRLYANGQVYTWSNSRRIRRDGKTSREAAPYAWRLDAQVNAEGVEQVRKLISSTFVQLTPDSPPEPAQDQGTVVWRSREAGVEHSVTTLAMATSALPQVLRDIDYAIQSHIVPQGVPVEQP